MKALFIWREESKSYITKLSSSLGDKTIVCNKENLSQLKLNSFHAIFILVELNWSDTVFDGYNVASSIIKDWKDDNTPPNIQFFSCIDQLKLYEYTKNTDKFFVKSFTHHILPFNNSFNSKPYSKSKWKYLKKYALTKSGILETINHDLKRDLTDSEINFDKKFTYYKEKLLSINTLLNDDIVQLLGNSNLGSKQKLKDLSELIGLRMQELNLIESNKSLVYEGVKERILLVEDDEEFANKIKEALEVYFEVFYYSNGKEALEALEVGGITYQALITDLELLEKNKKIDQPIQGIEILEKVTESYPYIVKRIVSGLPRKGISELVNIDINDVLYKSVIAFYGFSEGFETWVKKLKKDIKAHKDLKHMKGPNNAFWKDIEYSIDKKTGLPKPSGSGFKRFYYELKKEDNKTFEAMWNRIYSRVINILTEKQDAEKVETELIQTQRGQGYLTKENRDKSIEFLETILTHRLIWLSFFDSGDEVIYKDLNDIENSFSHKPFWKIKIIKGKETTLKPKPTGQFTYLDFSVIPIVPKKTNDIKEATEFVKIAIKYDDKQLFDKEERFLLENAKLIKYTVSQFAIQNLDLCEIMFEVFLNIDASLLNGNNGLQTPSLYAHYDINIIKNILDFVKNNSNDISKVGRDNIYNCLDELTGKEAFNLSSKEIQAKIDTLLNLRIWN